MNELEEFLLGYINIPSLPELTVEAFLEEYKPKWINYCEIIILQNGNIVIASPCHTERMIKLTGKDKDYIYDIMPVYASPIHWLVNYTKNISVWNKFQLLPREVSKEQMKTLEILQLNKMIKINVDYVNKKDCYIIEK